MSQLLTPEQFTRPKHTGSVPGQLAATKAPARTMTPEQFMGTAPTLPNAAPSLAVAPQQPAPQPALPTNPPVTPQQPRSPTITPPEGQGPISLEPQFSFQKTPQQGQFMGTGGTPGRRDIAFPQPDAPFSALVPEIPQGVEQLVGDAPLTLVRPLPELRPSTGPRAPSLGEPQASTFEQINAYAKNLARKAGLPLARPLIGIAGRIMGGPLKDPDLDAVIEAELQRELKPVGREAAIIEGGFKRVAELGAQEHGVAFQLASFGAEIIGSIPYIKGIAGVASSGIPKGQWALRLMNEAGLFSAVVYASDIAEGKGKEEAFVNAVSSGAGYFTIGAAFRGLGVAFGKGKKSLQLRRNEKIAFKKLGLKKGATPEQLRAAHNELVKKLHPDNFKTGDAEAFREVREAYELLSKKAAVPTAPQPIQPPTTGTELARLPARQAASPAAKVGPVAPKPPTEGKKQPWEMTKKEHATVRTDSEINTLQQERDALQQEQDTLIKSGDIEEVSPSQFQAVTPKGEDFGKRRAEWVSIMRQREGNIAGREMQHTKDITNAQRQHETIIQQAPVKVAPESVEPPTEMAQKQPWEMTAKEWLVTDEGQHELRNAHLDEYNGSKILFATTKRNRSIQQALSENKPVPLAVLQEYKDEEWAKKALSRSAPDVVAGKTTAGSGTRNTKVISDTLGSLASQIQPNALVSIQLARSASGQPTAIKTSADSGIINPELLRNIFNSPTLLKKGFSSLSVPSRKTVKADVLAILNNDQVLGAVIQNIPVDVMNVFIGQKFSAEELLRNKAMIRDTLAISSGAKVSRAMDAIISSLASLRAEVPLSSLNPRANTQQSLSTIQAKHPSLHRADDTLKSIDNQAGNQDSTKKRADEALGKLEDKAKPHRIVSKKTSDKALKDVSSPQLSGKLASPGPASPINEIDRGRIKVSMEPAGKPRAAREIVSHLQRAFNIPIRGKATHTMRGALGWFDPKATGIRLRNVRAITAAAHEIGHHIDWTLNNRMSKKPPSTDIAKELVVLGKKLYGSRQPEGGYKSEGFAEFIRMWITGEDTNFKAPFTHRWFTENYLPKHQDVAKKFSQAQKMVGQWRMQGAESRIESQINRKPIRGTIGEQAESLSLWLDTMFRDELAPLRRAMKRAGIKKEQLRPSEDPYQLAVAYADKAGAKSRQFVLHYTTDMAGNRTGQGLREIVKPITKDIKAFTRWIAAVRARDLWKRGINPGMSQADADFVYEKYDSPEWQQVALDITDWNHRVLDYLVEAGGLEKAAAKKMKELNPIYIPFMRAFAKGEIRSSGGTGRGLTQAGTSVKAIRGSGREIIDPFEAMIQQTEKIISIAHKADVSRSLAELADKPGMASMIWKVPPPKQATKFTAEQIKKDIAALAVKHFGIDPAEASTSLLMDEWDEVLTVYTNATAYYGKDNIVSLVRDGKREFYEVNKDLYAVLQGLDQYTLPWFLNITFGMATRAVRLGATGLNPAFGLIRNFIRDAGTFSVLSKHAKLGPVSAAGGVVADIIRTPSAQKFKALGGKMSGQILHDRTATQHLRGEFLASTVGKYTIHHATHPINATRELLGVNEAGTRIGEFDPALKYAEKRWGKGSKDAAIYALNAAQDVTTNFTRHGRITKVLNQMIPFYNAAIQGPDKIARTIKERPVRTVFAAIAYLTIPAIWLWWRNKDEEWYKSLPDYERTNYLHFKIPGKDTIVRIPVPFELGHIFQSIPVAALDSQYTKDGKILLDVLVESAKQANPFGWPAAIGPAVEVIANKDWAGRPIVPASLQNKLPEDQAKHYTTQIMRQVGRVIKVSPAQLEYLANSYSGGLYSRVSRTAEQFTGQSSREKTMSDYPVIGTLFLRDAYAPKREIEQFYNRRDLLSQKKASGKISFRENRLRLRHGRAARKLSPLWKKLRVSKTESERKALYTRIRRIVESVQNQAARLP